MKKEFLEFYVPLCKKEKKHQEYLGGKALIRFEQFQNDYISDYFAALFTNNSQALGNFPRLEQLKSKVNESFVNKMANLSLEGRF